MDALLRTDRSWPTFERFRPMRHSAQYYDSDGPAITHDDAAWAISTAQSAAEGTRRISESGACLGAEGGSGPAEVFVAARPSRWTRR